MDFTGKHGEPVRCSRDRDQARRGSIQYPISQVNGVQYGKDVSSRSAA